MKLSGDPEAIAALQAQEKANKGFVKALMEDASTTTDHATYFRGIDGGKYKLTFDAATKEINVVKREASVPPGP